MQDSPPVKTSAYFRPPTALWFQWAAPILQAREKEDKIQFLILSKRKSATTFNEYQ